MKIKKTPIVVNDARGFYTSRCFSTYVAEGMQMLAEGLAPAIIDQCRRALTGMPRGPLEMADDVALDLAYKIADQTAKDLGPGLCRRSEERGEERGVDAIHEGHEGEIELRPLTAAKNGKETTTTIRGRAPSSCGLACPAWSPVATLPNSTPALIEGAQDPATLSLGR